MIHKILGATLNQTGSEAWCHDSRRIVTLETLDCFLQAETGIELESQLASDFSGLSNIYDDLASLLAEKFQEQNSRELEAQSQQALETFINVVRESDLICRSIAIISNQILGLTVDRVFQQEPRYAPHKLSKQEIPFNLSNAIGGPVSGGTHRILKYDLTKKRTISGNPYFILKYRYSSFPKMFYLKKEEPVDLDKKLSCEPSLHLDITKSNIHSKTAATLKIKPNQQFDPSQPITQTNIPCQVECLKFTNKYSNQRPDDSPVRPWRGLP